MKSGEPGGGPVAPPTQAEQFYQQPVEDLVQQIMERTEPLSVQKVLDYCRNTARSHPVDQSYSGGRAQMAEIIGDMLDVAIRQDSKTQPADASLRARLEGLIAKWRAEAQEQSHALYSAETAEWDRIRTMEGRQRDICADELASALRGVIDAPPAPPDESICPAHSAVSFTSGCVLPYGHEGDHNDGNGTRWFPIDRPAAAALPGDALPRWKEQSDGGPFTVEAIQDRWKNVPTWHDGWAASKDIGWLITKLGEAEAACARLTDERDAEKQRADINYAVYVRTRDKNSEQINELRAEVAALRAHLKEIAERDTDCDCDHTTEDCCAVVNMPEPLPRGYFCARCYAAKGLAALLAEDGK